MTGFIRGFFSKPQSIEAEAAPVEKAKKVAPAEKQDKSFFLDADSAQTFGNAEYMRESKTIRRTFPKTLDSPEHKEYVQSLSATQRDAKGESKIAPERTVESQPAASSEPASTPKRSLGSDMDMFLNMAKDIRK